MPRCHPRINQRTGADLNTENHSQTANFIWGVADLLRGDFVKYGGDPQSCRGSAYAAAAAPRNAGITIECQVIVVE